MGCLSVIKSCFTVPHRPSEPAAPAPAHSDKEPVSDTNDSITQIPSTIPNITTTSTMSLPKTYKQAAFHEAGGNLVVSEVELKQPAAGEILVKVEACGVCHSDIQPQHNLWGSGFPLVPGHEVIGTVAAVGEGVKGWNAGDRVGAAWHGGMCESCGMCNQGLYQFCAPYIVNGVTRNGGYGEYCIVRSQAAVRVPAGVDAAKFAPMLCAGATVFNSIKAAKLSPGDTVAVQGLGGVGHMAVQYARKMGYRVIAVSRGSSKEAAARELGAHEYIDSEAGDAGEAIQKLGCANLVVTTALDTAAITPLIKGLAIYGRLLILSLPQPAVMELNTFELLTKGGTVQCFPVGNYLDVEEALRFASLQGLESVVETFPLDDAQKAFDAMLSGKVRFRAVITM
jgi:D-arabinose 1-dehydrogenase-like Zn-dependent alcohol dehydrogenase